MDIDETLSPADKYASVCQLGMDLGFSVHELIDEIHHALSGTSYETDQPSNVELLSYMTLSPPILADKRRHSCSSRISVSKRRVASKLHCSVITPAESISSRADAEQGHGEERLSQIRWDGLKEVVIENGSNLMLLQFHPWRKTLSRKV